MCTTSTGARATPFRTPPARLGAFLAVLHVVRGALRGAPVAQLLSNRRQLEAMVRFGCALRSALNRSIARTIPPSAAAGCR